MIPECPERFGVIAVRYLTTLARPRQETHVTTTQYPADPATGRPMFDDGEVDSGCSACGTCIKHDGCADDINKIADGDCSECGACADCIAVCAEQHPTA